MYHAFGHHHQEFQTAKNKPITGPGMAIQPHTDTCHFYTPEYKQALPCLQEDKGIDGEHCFLIIMFFYIENIHHY